MTTAGNEGKKEFYRVHEFQISKQNAALLEKERARPSAWIRRERGVSGNNLWGSGRWPVAGGRSGDLSPPPPRPQMDVEGLFLPYYLVTSSSFSRVGQFGKIAFFPRNFSSPQVSLIISHEFSLA